VLCHSENGGGPAAQSVSHLFGTGLQTINLLELENSLDQVVAFLTRTFNGGTDIHPPLYEALRMLKTAITKTPTYWWFPTSLCTRCGPTLLKRCGRTPPGHPLSFAHRKPVGQSGVVELFDNYWLYHPERRDIARQLASDLRKLEESR
jgi:hypothetical protein